MAGHNGREEIYRRFKAADAAYRRGELAALREALGRPREFPNFRQPIEWGLGTYPRGYAIYWSPLAFIRELISAGADLNYDDGMGFPSLIAAMSTERSDKSEILKLLVLEGADLNQRGINDWTPLHYATACKDIESLKILLEAGADRSLRTRIDDYETPLELAVRSGFAAGASLLSASAADRSRS